MTNTGNVALTDVAVSDPGPVGGKGEMSEVTCESDELAVDGRFTCTATYTLDPADKAAALAAKDSVTGTGASG